MLGSNGDGVAFWSLEDVVADVVRTGVQTAGKCGCVGIGSPGWGAQYGMMRLKHASGRSASVMPLSMSSGVTGQ